MRQFRWHSAGPIPAGLDLRRLGWQLREAPGASGDGEAHPLLVRPEGLVFSEWLKLAGATPAVRKWMLMLDVSDGHERARLLRLGFGDALAPGLSLEELEQCLQRMIEQAQALPRTRRHGPLQLDPLAREAFVAGRALDYTRASSRCSGGWPTIRVSRLVRASCSAMSGGWRSGPRPTAWRSMSAGCAPNCAFRGLTG